ncbi:hypothetical protein B0H14DRAFT_3714875 [Mycena olivaceomarginata]|nr:hypothetical protein B0H14DRAFT_3714875 [Mycena olivaceomarginata]
MSDAFPPVPVSPATTTPGPARTADACPASTTTAGPTGSTSHGDGARPPPPIDAPLNPVAAPSMAPPGPVGTAPDESGTPPRSPSAGGTPDTMLTAPPMAPAIITRVKEKRGRHTKGTAKAPPGKTSWVYGTKKVFFAKRKDDWLRETEAGKASQFYIKMVKLYIKKYGRHLADDQDFAFDVADPPDKAANEVVHEVLDSEEEAFRKAYLKTLRGRISQWYRLNYGSLIKSDKTAFKEMFTGALDGAPPKPQRGRPIHFYSRKYYDTRIKSRVEERLESLKRRAERDGNGMPQTIDVISKVTAEMYNEESPVFREEIELAAEREYQQAVKAWEVSLADSPTRTPEEMAATLANAAYYLQPFAEAIQQRFGMCVSILLCGPIGERGGRVGVQSIHAGETRGVAPMDWPVFDWQGYMEVEARMIEFGSQCFSEVECKARAVASKPGRGASAATTPPSTVPPPAVPGSSGGAEGQSEAPSASSTAQVPPSDVNMERVPPPAVPGSSGGAEGPSEAPSASSTAQVPPSDVDMERQGARAPPEGEVHPEHHREGEDYPEDGRQDGEGQRGEKEVETYDEHWQRADRAEWTVELGRAHAAFEVGRSWGVEWAGCVQRFFDFEGAWGFVEGSRSMPKPGRPPQVSGWLSRGRKWTMPPALGGLLGRRQAVGMTAELWVGVWWGWWRGLQPVEREVLENGELSHPETADWSTMAKMYGNNGLMQVMAALVWWGEVAQKRGEEDIEEWRAAVRDVTWVLDQLLRSGEIRKDVRDDGDVDDEEDTEEAAAPEKDGKRKRKVSAGGKKKSDDKADEGDEERPKKRPRKKAVVADSEGPRCASRLRGEEPGETARRTRSAAGQAKGKEKEKVVRPKPKPLYQGKN